MLSGKEKDGFEKVSMQCPRVNAVGERHNVKPEYQHT